MHIGEAAKKSGLTAKMITRLKMKAQNRFWRIFA